MAQSSNSTSFLKEWAPLTDVFSKLPTRTGGIFSQEVKLTCIDALPEFLVLGTNVGIIYWYDRKKKDLQRLRCENTNTPITFVKVVSTVDFMVACGNQTGSMTIFQIPKSHPDSLPETLKPKQKQVERYTVTDLHKTPITSMEWSKNGMKLFSGDKSGSVVLTEIDFYMHMCKSVEILNESYEVVQLSYNQKRLLVSTTFRSIICQQLDKWKVCQVGKKDRKVLGPFGGLIVQNGLKPTDIVLYCTRPGLRTWIADIEGNVQKTLLFKDLLCKECPQVPLLNPITKAMQQLKPQREPSFGILLPFCENLLVTHSNDIVYILNPAEMTILATVAHLRSILDVAAYKDEIFILEEERSLLRISFRPESYNSASSPINSATNKTFSLAVTPLKDTFQATTELFTNSLNQKADSQGEIDIHTDDTSVLKAEEAQESPKEEFKKFDDIGKQDFEENIIFKKTKKSKKKKKDKMSASTMSLSSNSSEEKDLSFTRPTIMNLSAVGVLPDLRSPESIINDIEYKEKILADVLSFDKVHISSLDAGQDPKIDNKSKAKEHISHVRDNVAVKSIKDDKSSPPYEYNTKKKINVKVRQSVELPKGSKNGSVQNQQGAQNSSSSGKKGVISQAPVVNIPNEWNLSNIQLKQKETDKKTTGQTTQQIIQQTTSIPVAYTRRDSTNDSSLSDWEIV